ncbi:hypothetical protein CD175_06535 [Pseudomonas laurylsulfatiphila]|uniref:Uncharacterized protein n=1 Tax=Pseudomonas laurylsulfatiphila TaxID=2011015 RepID=A0A2S6FNU5_9PSED|nr:hypothetical protein CD175_06535 [Pseudomonas laurylsulfatiphila]
MVGAPWCSPVYREQARSYRGALAAGENTNSVGASPLAMVVNDNAGWQVPRGVLWFIASRLAPTDGIGCRRKHKPCRSEPARDGRQR